MARLNKKLLFVVTLGSALTVGVGGVVFYQTYRGDPMRHLRAGDTAFAAGDFRKAADSYGRAISKRQSDLSFYAKYLDAASRVVPESASEAQERYNLYIGTLARRAQISRGDAALWQVLLDELRLQGEILSTSETWRVVADRIQNEMLSSLGETDPLVPLGAAYYGYAQAQRADAVTADERSKYSSQIEAAIPSLKDRPLDLAYGALLRLAFNDARTLAAAGQKDRADIAWKTFDELLAKAQAASPNGANVQQMALERLALRRQNGDTAVTEAMVDAASSKLMADVLASDDAVDVFNTWRTVGASNGSKGFDLASTFLETYLAKHPDAILHRHALARTLQSVDLDRAEAQAKAIVAAPRLPVSLMSATQEEIRVSAAVQLFDIEFIRFSAAKDEAARAASLANLEKLRAEVAELTKGSANNFVVTKADGKLLFAKEDFAGAAQKFNELMKAGALVDAELYVLASLTAERQNMLGSALENAVAGLDLVPGNIDLIERKAGLEQQLGRFDEARRTAEIGLTIQPDNARLLKLRELAGNASQPLGVNPDDPRIKALVEAERAFAAKDLAKADSILSPVLEKYPDDVSILTAMAQLRFSQDKRDEALKFARRGLELSPGNKKLLQLVAFLESDDPVQRVITLVSQQHPEGPERVVWTYVRLGNLADQTEIGLPAVQRGNPTEADRQAKLIPAMRTAEAEWKTKAYGIDPFHPAILDLEFTRAIAKKDYDAANKIVATASEKSKDAALPFMLKARLAVETKKYGEAVSTVQQAFDRNLDSADMWRLMGYAYEQAGDLPAALRAYAEGYKRDPLNMNNARAYVSSLIKSGERQQALVILREARKVAVDDAEIGDIWIQLEYEIGDRSLARSMREGRYRLAPTDKRNALALATMLSELQPNREDIGDERGVTKYNPPQWQALDEATRQREINAARDAWRRKSDTIFAELIAADPANPELALVRAATYRRQGKLPEAEGAIKSLITRAGDKATPPMFVALGMHYAESGDLAKATEAFNEALKREPEATRDSSAAIAEYWFQRAQWEKAIENFERVDQKIDSRSLSLRMAEAYGKLKQFDKAKAKIAEAVKDGGRDVVIDQLEANLSEGLGDDRRAKGDIQGAIASYDEGLAALDRAAVAMANNPIIAIQQASLLRKEFDATNNEAKLKAALAAADRATKLRADFWPAAQAKSELLLAMRDVNGAMAELERFMKAAPSSVDGRRRLVEMLAATGKLARAQELVSEAIGLAPSDPQWYLARGELEAAQGRVDSAILAFEQADRLRADPTNLERITELKLRRPSPDWQDILAGLRARTDDLKASPYLQGAVAAAMYNAGDTRRGIDALRESYRSARAMVAANPENQRALDRWYATLRFVYPTANTADAEKFVMEASEGKPTAQDLRWLAEMWAATGASGSSRAIETAQRAIAADDKKNKALTARLFDIIGGVKFSSGDCTGALEAFGKAAETLPDEPAILNNFAYVAAECGTDLKPAIAAAERAAQIASSNADYLDTFGYVLFKSGDRSRAKQVLNDSLRVRETASANYHLALIAVAENDKDGARSFLKAAGDLGPDPLLQKQINELIQQLR
ncbi:MAG: tetratricopeptide repeat protein [Phycisphaerae bacterium]|nr:tetratricopeptide repeat protein [Phycisphaerae bacterium]